MGQLEFMRSSPEALCPNPKFVDDPTNEKYSIEEVFFNICGMVDGSPLQILSTSACLTLGGGRISNHYNEIREVQRRWGKDVPCNIGKMLPLARIWASDVNVELYAYTKGRIKDFYNCKLFNLFNESTNQSTAHTYGRFGNPTRSTLEKCIAALDNTNYALTFTSGCAAIHALLHLLKTGDHIVSSNEQFGPDAALEDFCKATGVEVDFVDSTVLKQIEDAIKPNTKMIWIMTPSNPRLRYSDVASIAKIAHSHPNIILAVDNTFLTPYFLRALDLGADIVMYSLTKYLNGHNDVMGGALTFLSEELYKKVKYFQAAFGIALSPFDCYLTNRGLKTLALRMQKHSDNGIAIARYLQSHPMVSKVMHPVLPSHPDHELAMTQCSGYSSVVSFEIKGTLKEAKKFVQSLQIIQSCGSLGSYASFAMLPIAQLFSGKEAWYKLGVHENLIRFSTGLENADDLIKDMEQSFDKTYQ